MSLHLFTTSFAKLAVQFFVVQIPFIKYELIGVTEVKNVM
jgi:hypothetical protein